MQVNTTAPYLFIYFIISTVCSIYKDAFFPGTGLAKFQGTGQPNSLFTLTLNFAMNGSDRVETLAVQFPYKVSTVVINGAFFTSRRSSRLSCLTPPPFFPRTSHHPPPPNITFYALNRGKILSTGTFSKLFSLTKCLNNGSS